MNSMLICIFVIEEILLFVMDIELGVDIELIGIMILIKNFDLLY